MELNALGLYDTNLGCVLKHETNTCEFSLTSINGRHVEVDCSVVHFGRYRSAAPRTAGERASTGHASEARSVFLWKHAMGGGWCTGGSALSPKHRVRAQWRRWTEMLVDTLLRKQAGRRETESPRNWSMNSSGKANKKNYLSIYLSIVRKTSPKFSDDFNKSNAYIF